MEVRAVGGAQVSDYDFPASRELTGNLAIYLGCSVGSCFGECRFPEIFECEFPGWENRELVHPNRDFEKPKL